jgi:hypothetical protein
MRGDQVGVSLKKLNHGLTRMGRMHTDFKLKKSVPIRSIRAHPYSDLRVLRVSACIKPAHAEARRRGERERSAYKVCWTGLHPSPEAGASRDTADRNNGQCIREML